jgi:hypothetical protein
MIAPLTAHAESVRRALSQGARTAIQLADQLGVSQPTVSRALAALGGDVLRIGAARSIHYLLKDARRRFGDFPVYRVNAAGGITPLGVLTPVCPAGFVMQQADGVVRHSEGLPWWLDDMRPQGFLGRAYVARHGQALGLPDTLAAWGDDHTVRALLVHGHDAVGNLLLGERARDAFVHAPPPVPLAPSEHASAFVARAADAARGEVPGSSAGGEQPKFAACVASRVHGGQHVLVKFTLPDTAPDGGNPVTERWRDLLLAEHLALQALADAGVDAARSQLFDHAGQRFLIVHRFDRVGLHGRRAVHSLAALNAEFVGLAAEPWPVKAQRLQAQGHISRDAAAGAALLWAFGRLIGNTDMHDGNLSFVAEHGRPCALAPAYDMLPMAFAPSAGGGLPGALAPITLHASVGNAVWREAWLLAQAWLQRVRADMRFSPRFAPCVDALAQHLADAAGKVARLG